MKKKEIKEKGATTLKPFIWTVDKLNRVYTFHKQSSTILTVFDFGFLFIAMKFHFLIFFIYLLSHEKVKFGPSSNLLQGSWLWARPTKTRLWGKWTSKQKTIRTSKWSSRQTSKCSWLRARPAKTRFWGKWTSKWKTKWTIKGSSRWTSICSWQMFL